MIESLKNYQYFFCVKNITTRINQNIVFVTITILANQTTANGTSGEMTNVKRLRKKSVALGF